MNMIDMNNMILMDYIRLESEVRKNAADYLEVINEENLRSFTESTKFVTLSVLENYFLSIDELYSEGVKKIKDEVVLDKFLDFHDGYRAKMKNWINDHDIEVRQMNQPPAFQYQKKNKDIMYKPALTAGIGTVMAVGLFIFTDAWAFAVAELLSLGMAVYVFKQEYDSREKEYAFKLEQYKIQIEQQKAKLVNRLLVDLKKWLEDAEVYSNSLLTTFLN